MSQVALTGAAVVKLGRRRGPPVLFKLYSNKLTVKRPTKKEAPSSAEKGRCIAAGNLTASIVLFTCHWNLVSPVGSKGVRKGASEYYAPDPMRPTDYRAILRVYKTPPPPLAETAPRQPQPGRVRSDGWPAPVRSAACRINAASAAASFICTRSTSAAPSCRARCSQLCASASEAASRSASKYKAPAQA